MNLSLPPDLKIMCMRKYQHTSRRAVDREQRRRQLTGVEAAALWVVSARLRFRVVLHCEQPAQSMLIIRTEQIMLTRLENGNMVTLAGFSTVIELSTSTNLMMSGQKSVCESVSRWTAAWLVMSLSSNLMTEAHCTQTERQITVRAPRQNRTRILKWVC